MSSRLRIVVPAVLAVAAVSAGILLTGGLGPPVAIPGGSGTTGTGGPNGLASGGPGDPGSVIAPTPTPRPPEGGTELYGYLPYWQMSTSMARYLDDVPLTTLALFSVTVQPDGALDRKETGYRRITGGIGRRLIEEAHRRGQRVDLVFSSFGADTNAVLFGRQLAEPSASATDGIPGSSGSATAGASAPPASPPWHRTVDGLIALVSELGVDGVNVDVERLDGADREAYGEFLSALRAALRSADPESRLTAATEAGFRGIENAVQATQAGVDRLFLMGYDYHYSGSPPGATAPVERADGLYTLRWSIDGYVAAGVPRDRILLGLPLYGMTWRTTGPDRTAPVVGTGATWIPNRHLDVLLDPGFTAGRDTLEIAEFFVTPDDDNTWLVTYYDSPATLRPKLGLARDSGLAGAGFWAIGYERGLPGYVDLMADFRDGDVGRDEAPPRTQGGFVPGS